MVCRNNVLFQPWTTLRGIDLPIRALPGSQGRAEARPGWTGPSAKALSESLAHVSGFEGTPLGPVDFTGTSHDEDALGVLRPAINFAIGPDGRRWFTEVTESAVMSCVVRVSQS